ncbi:MAG TPA: L,D-transpeptidase family protein, partial [Rhizomicrobium sp.]|nr:L,D-transpeptidase family protein [Rhizomicrobium sp.]
MSVLYLAAASSFTVAIALAQHPAWNAAAHSGARFAGEQGAKAAVAINDYVLQPGWSLTKTASVALFEVAAEKFNMIPDNVASRTKPVVVAQAKHPAEKEPFVVATAEPKESIAAEKHVLAPPDLRPTILDSKPAVAPPSARAVASVPNYTLATQTPVAPKTPAQIAPPPIDDQPPSAAELVRVSTHFRQSLTKEMLANFELFLYVSKADRGALAQRMYVFQKQSSGDLVMLYNWPVSTGRELIEMAANGTMQPSFTPAGYYELDPKRMYVRHFSGQWKQPMPYAMFFNWENHGYQTGLAIHGAEGADVGLLGARASAGCVRIAPEHARVLFSLIRNNYKGLMPKFAYDKRTATMSNQGV